MIWERLVFEYGMGSGYVKLILMLLEFLLYRVRRLQDHYERRLHFSLCSLAEMGLFLQYAVAFFIEVLLLVQ